jgi:hypothetical protein
MVVPDGQDGEHVSCKTAMDRNKRTKDTMPVLHSTAGSNRLIPGGKQLGCQRLPSRGKIGDEQVSLPTGCATRLQQASNEEGKRSPSMARKREWGDK